jgi:hypothetical protein
LHYICGIKAPIFSVLPNNSAQQVTAVHGVLVATIGSFKLELLNAFAEQRDV